jgi:outer membrane protein
VNIPIFNGHLFGALRNEASSRARADDQYVRDLQDRIVRDVRIAWLNAGTGYQRLAVAAQLLKNATDALDLATQRYHLGLSSIIELSQAQLNLTQAQLESADSKYDYQAQLSTLQFQIGALR